MLIRNEYTKYSSQGNLHSTLFPHSISRIESGCLEGFQICNSDSWLLFLTRVGSSFGVKPWLKTHDYIWVGSRLTFNYRHSYIYNILSIFVSIYIWETYNVCEPIQCLFLMKLQRRVLLKDRIISGILAKSIQSFRCTEIRRIKNRVLVLYIKGMATVFIVRNKISSWRRPTVHLFGNVVTPLTV